MLPPQQATNAQLSVCACVLLGGRACSSRRRRLRLQSAPRREKRGGRFDKKAMRLAPPWPFDAAKMRTSWRVFWRSLNHAAARFAIASAAAWPSRWSEPHQNHHYAWSFKRTCVGTMLLGQSGHWHCHGNTREWMASLWTWRDAECRLMINFMIRGARRRRNHGEESGEA